VDVFFVVPILAILGITSQNERFRQHGDILGYAIAGWIWEFPSMGYPIAGWFISYKGKSH